MDKNLTKTELKKALYVIARVLTIVIFAIWFLYFTFMAVQLHNYSNPEVQTNILENYREYIQSEFDFNLTDNMRFDYIYARGNREYGVAIKFNTTLAHVIKADLEASLELGEGVISIENGEIVGTVSFPWTATSDKQQAILLFSASRSAYTFEEGNEYFLLIKKSSLEDAEMYKKALRGF